MKLYLTNPTLLFGKQQNRKKLFTLFGKLILQSLQSLQFYNLWMVSHNWNLEDCPTPRPPSSHPLLSLQKFLKILAQLTGGLYMKCNTGLKWVKTKLLPCGGSAALHSILLINTNYLSGILSLKSSPGGQS